MSTGTNENAPVRPNYREDERATVLVAPHGRVSQYGSEYGRAEAAALTRITKFMAQTREQIRDERRLLKKKYAGLFEQVAALLFKHDPVGIVFDNENSDEYEPEVGTILPRLSGCRSVEDVRAVVHEEFVRWFSDSETAGPLEHYDKIASEIWKLWSTY